MTLSFTRRALLVGATLFTTALALPAMAQDKPVLRFSAVFSEQDIRAEMMKQFGEAIAGDFTLEPYYGGNLFKQGTELVALQRGNLEMGNIAPQDVSNQIPRLVGADLRLSVPRRRASSCLLRQRSGRPVQEDGRRPARHPHPRPDLFRYPPGRPARRQGDQDARRHGRHQAPHARRRRLAVPRAPRSAPTPRRWPMPKSIPASRPARSTARTIRCPTSRT